MAVGEGNERMKFGAQLKVYRARWDEMEAYIQAMEAGRWNSIWFPDHFLPPVPVAGIPAEQDERNPAYEAFIPLAERSRMRASRRCAAPPKTASKICSGWMRRSSRRSISRRDRIWRFGTNALSWCDNCPVPLRNAGSASPARQSGSARCPPK